jgi:peptidylprolyl isomerase
MIEGLQAYFLKALVFCRPVFDRKSAAVAPRHPRAFAAAQKGKAMTAAQNGDRVKVHYTGKLNDGTVFDTSREGDPIEFAIGSQMVIAGFEDAVLGMEPGDSKSFTVASAEAYGEHDPCLVQEVPRSELPPELEPQPGMRLSATGRDGREIGLVITEVNDTAVRLDANHPLAGEDLTFEIQLVEIAA